MAYIYKITNDINQKIYIGKTEFSIEKRFKEHCADSKKTYCEKRPLYSAMNKYGIEHFYIELIEETNKPEEQEKYWIKYYNSYKNGYNATLGGDGKTYVNENQIVSLWNQGKNCKEINNITNYDYKTIRLYLHKNNITQEEIKQRQLQNQSKKVAMIDKTNNNIIAIFQGSGEAGKYIGKSGSHIREVCNNKRKTAYGYIWKYI